MRTMIAFISLGAALAVPAVAQDDNFPPTIRIISWQVTRSGQVITVYDPNSADPDKRTRSAIAEFQHFERDQVFVLFRIDDLDWTPMADPNMDMDAGAENETVRLRITQDAFPFGNYPPTPPPIVEAEGEYFPEDDGFPPNAGAPVPFFRIDGFFFEVPEFNGRNQARLRDFINFDVRWFLSIEVVNEVPDMGRGFADGQTFGAIQNPFPSPNNPPPFADAGPDQRVAVGATVRLDGSRTFDGFNIGFDPADEDIIEKDILNYSWEWLSGPVRVEPVQTVPTDPKATVEINTVGTYVFRLTVDDNVNAAPSTDEVKVEVLSEIPINRKPTAVITTPLDTVVAGNIVTLDAGASFDPDDDDVLKYRWRQVDELGTNLDTDDIANLFQPLSGLEDVMAMWQANKPGTYFFRLLVDDGQFVSTATTSIVVVPSVAGARASRVQEPTPTTDAVSDEVTPPAVTTPLCGLGAGLVGLAPFALIPMRRRFRR